MIFRRFLAFVCLFVCLCCGLSDVVVSVGVTVPSAGVVNDMNVWDDKVSYGSVYNDAKFKFTCFNMSKQGYKVSLSRKDDDFAHKYVQFIYNVVVIQNNRLVTIPKYILLSPGQKNVTLTEYLYDASFLTIKNESYGIKFPPLVELDDDERSINDAVFNLKLDYYARFVIPTFFGCEPYLNYTLYRRDGEKMDCHVTLKRAITLYVKGQPPIVHWSGFGLERDMDSTEGTVHHIADLTTFQCNADEYYLQFSQ